MSFGLRLACWNYTHVIRRCEKISILSWQWQAQKVTRQLLHRQNGLPPSLVGDDLNHWNNFLVQAERGAVMLNCAAWHNYS
jgi:hypothetical protein